MYPLPDPADLVIVSHYTFEGISDEITSMQDDLKGIIDRVQLFGGYVMFTFVVCKKDVDKMLHESSAEHLQPMKEKMEQFIGKIERTILTFNTKLTSTQEHFNKVYI